MSCVMAKELIDRDAILTRAYAGMNGPRTEQFMKKKYL